MEYKTAKSLATSKNPNVSYSGDAGNGCTFVVYWCPRRKRQIWSTITPAGVAIL